MRHCKSSIPPGFKRCSRGEKCLNPNGAVQPAESFYAKRAALDGLRPECKSCGQVGQRIRRAKNPEKRKEGKRRWYASNSEKERERNRRWYAANSGTIKEGKRHSDQCRRARERELASTFTAADWGFALQYFGNRCAYCQRQRGLWQTPLAQDHFMPLTKNGAYVPTNIVPACNGRDGCNTIKGNKDPHVWLLEYFGKRKAAYIEKQIKEYFDYWRSHNNLQGIESPANVSTR